MADRLRDKVQAEAARVLRERSARLKQALERALESLGEPVEFPLAPGDWGAGEGEGRLQALRDAAESLARHPNQRDILTALLDAGAAFYPRVVLFVHRDDVLQGWAGLGFLGEGGFSSQSVARLRLNASGAHLPGRALTSRTVQQSASEGPGDPVVAALGGVRPAAACAVPVLVRDRAAAVLYGDSGAAGSSGEPLAFEILARIAGLALERLGATARAQPGPESETRGAARPGAASPGRAGALTPPEDSEVQALLADLETPPRRAGSGTELPDEDRRRHADARRFAKLLVSEILLYNEDAVVNGRRHRDLARRLEKEIDRSRRAYEARFPKETYGTDYFAEELVRTLAQGNPSLLGASAATARPPAGRLTSGR